jgi:teichoic acid transport system ATP-binding protein
MAVADPMVVVDDLHIVYRVYGAGGSKGTAATAMMRLLRRQNRPGMREVHAIRGISFVANRGDAVGIIGRNGSGKSTLLRAIAGLLPPEKGAVYTTGEASLLGVNAALLDDLTGERNVVLGCLAMGMSPAEVKSRFNDIVEFSGVGDFIDLPMRTYSSGMGSRLRFAIASAKSHDVLLIDEALATGDAPFRAKSHKRIMELREESGAVFLVAHNLSEVEETCNRVIWLEPPAATAAPASPSDPRRGTPECGVTPEIQAGMGAGTAAASWRTRRMIVPPVARERASTSPPWATARRRTMNKPMPMPPKRRRSPASPWKKRSKIRSWSPSAMPMPRSSTVTSIRPPAARARTTTSPPWGEYLNAFSSSWPTMMSVAMVSP